jgi:hypothetical protein
MEGPLHYVTRSLGATRGDLCNKVATLEHLGCRKIYADRISGQRRERGQLAACLDCLREDDVLASLGSTASGARSPT